jgi:hypothetical protein
MVTVAGAQVQGAGQSASLLQLVAFDWQVPGYEGALVQVGGEAMPASRLRAGGGTATGVLVSPDPPAPPDAFPPPELAVPVPTLPGVLGADPEHTVDVVGWHRKPSPQSASALHGSCHGKMHWLRVESVQVGGRTFVGSHAAFGSQMTGAAVPPVQVVTGWRWQTMPCAHSASRAQVCA